MNWLSLLGAAYRYSLELNTNLMLSLRFGNPPFFTFIEVQSHERNTKKIFKARATREYVSVFGIGLRRYFIG